MFIYSLNEGRNSVLSGTHKFTWCIVGFLMLALTQNLRADAEPLQDAVPPNLEADVDEIGLVSLHEQVSVFIRFAKEEKFAPLSNTTKIKVLDSLASQKRHLTSKVLASDDPVVASLANLLFLHARILGDYLIGNVPYRTYFQVAMYVEHHGVVLTDYISAEYASKSRSQYSAEPSFEDLARSFYEAIECPIHHEFLGSVPPWATDIAIDGRKIRLRLEVNKPLSFPEEEMPHLKGDSAIDLLRNLYCFDDGPLGIDDSALAGKAGGILQSVAQAEYGLTETAGVLLAVALGTSVETHGQLGESPFVVTTYDRQLAAAHHRDCDVQIFD